MEKKQALFRKEAIIHRLNKSLGTTRLNVPFNYRVASVFALGLIVLILLFLLFAKTSEKTFVKGYLDIENGIVTMHSEQSGIILQGAIEEGKKVKKGEDLLIIVNTNQGKRKDLIKNMVKRIENLKREYKLKKEQYNALTKLHEKKYIASSLLKDTEAVLLEIENKIKSVDLELINYRQSQYQRIKSPVDGIVTNMFYKQGQIVEPSKVLLHIIPNNSKMVARLFIPSKDIGFFKKGKKVTIKYDAYPSQKFGFYKAVITEINLTALTDDKEDKLIKVGEPYYKIKAELEQQHINLNGKKAKLSHGMTFTALITGDNKKIWQWILYSARS